MGHVDEMAHTWCPPHYYAVYARNMRMDMCIIAESEVSCDAVAIDQARAVYGSGCDVRIEGGTDQIDVYVRDRKVAVYFAG